MKLVNYGVGEISDRLTILALKILFGAAAGKEVGHFRNEQVALLTQIRGRTLNAAWFEAYTELAAVNAALWHAEDDLRGYRQKTTEYHEHGVVALAFQIQTLNDQRAACVEKINKDAGDFGGVEKTYVKEEGEL